MRSMLSIVMVVLVLVVLVMDGSSMFAAYQTAQEVAQAAAEQAAIAYVGSQGNEATASRVAAAYVADKGAHLVRVEFHRGTGRWYETEVQVQPSTYVFKFVPVLSDALQRRSTAVVQF